MGPTYVIPGVCIPQYEHRVTISCKLFWITANTTGIYIIYIQVTGSYIYIFIYISDWFFEPDIKILNK